MSRPVDWHPLRTRDPLPGDPHQVAVVARRLRDTADLLRQQADRLRRLADTGSTRSRAWESFSAEVPAVADRLAKAQARYAAAGEALRRYGDALDDAQVDGDRALHEAKDAEARRGQAQGTLTRASQAYQAALREHQRRCADPLAPPAAPPSDWQVRSAERAVASAEQDVADARRRLDGAVAARDAAAAAARQSIARLGDDGLDDSAWTRLSGSVTEAWQAFAAAADRRWESVKAWVGEHAAQIQRLADIAGAVSAACGLLALVVGWIPVVGQVLASFLGAVAILAGVIALVATLALAVTGHGSWTRVVVDVLGLATGGVGRAFTGAAKASLVGARASARIAARGSITLGLRGGASPSAVTRHVNAVTGGQAGHAVARASTVAAGGTGRLPAWRHVRGSFGTPTQVRNLADEVRHARGIVDEVVAGRKDIGAALTERVPTAEVRELLRARLVHEPYRTADYHRLMAQAEWQLGVAKGAERVDAVLDVAELTGVEDEVVDRVDRWIDARESRR